MHTHPFVLADHDRVKQFALLQRKRRLFGNHTVLSDDQGLVWASAGTAGHCFGVSLLGPGWVFDPYARQQRADRFAARQHAIEASSAEQRAQQLEGIVASLRLGDIAHRILWAIHSRVIHARRSVVKIPEHRLARFIWGSESPPRNWRETLSEVITGLTWLHVARQPDEGTPAFGQATALLTHAANLKGSSNDRCDDDCPDLGGDPHCHYILNTGRGFLGCLEQFGIADDNTGVRSYEFKLRGKKDQRPTLRTVGKTGRLVSIYLPAKLGNPKQCSMLDARQHDLLQTIVRETTRNTKAKRNDISEAELFIKNSIPGIQRKNAIICPLLEPTGKYVGFNGNGKRRGLGYGLLTPGGWLVKSGYDLKDIAGFLADLAVLVEMLGLIAVGIHVSTKQIFDLDQLRALASRKDGQPTLRRSHLRIYTAADYVQRWNAYFGWTDETVLQVVTPVDVNAALLAALKRNSLTQRALAEATNVDPSFLSKLLRGVRTWPADKLCQAQSWLAQQGVDQVGVLEEDLRGANERSTNTTSQSVPVIPLLTGVAEGTRTMLEVALGYRSQGWAVVPQQPGAKQPCVKWKPFQERQPTAEELNAWFSQWPQAGLVVVLGPVSNLFAVDVDGSEAHRQLIDHLGAEPVAPKVISGSRQPDRYHLFFQCPAGVTKAKSTPWHPQLEFRGQGAVLVIPPSLHPSGNRYAWAEGQSIDDLPVPELPAEILAALQPAQPPAAVPVTPTVDVEQASVSTHDFLAGKYVAGPNWNDRLFGAACDLAGRGMSQQEAEPLLLAGAQPWNAAEEENARRTIASAFNQAREPAKY